MADIYSIKKEPTKLTLGLRNLDPKWDGGNRTVYWYYVVKDTNVAEAWEADWSNDIYGGYSTIKSNEGEECGIEIGGEVEIKNLVENTTYFIRAEVYRDDPFELLTDPPLYAKASTTSSSILAEPRIDRIRAHQNSVGKLDVLVLFRVYDAINFWYKLYIDSEIVDQGKIVAEAPDQNYVDVQSVFSVADFGDHEIYLQITEKSTSYIVLADASIYVTLVPSDSPNPWLWDENNAQIKAYNALVNKGLVTDFTHEVWNDFIERVKEFLVHIENDTSTTDGTNYGFSSNISYSDLLENAKMTEEDKVITAKRFNIVRHVIGSNSTGFSTGDNSIKTHQILTGSWDMKKNEKILGQYFLDLATYANKIIE